MWTKLQNLPAARYAGVGAVFLVLLAFVARPTESAAVIEGALNRLEGGVYAFFLFVAGLF